MNNGFDDLSSRVDTAEETISKLEVRWKETSQIETWREKIMWKTEPDINELVVQFQKI